MSQPFRTAHGNLSVLLVRCRLGMMMAPAAQTSERPADPHGAPPADVPMARADAGGTNLTHRLVAVDAATGDALPAQPSRAAGDLAGDRLCR